MTAGTPVRGALPGVGLLLVLLAVAALGFAPLYHGNNVGGPGLWVAAGGGLLAGAGLAVAGAARGWHPLSLACATVVAYLLLGGPLTGQQGLLGAVLPTPGTLQDLLVALVRSWKQALTVTPPAGQYPGLLVVPLVAALLAAAAAVSLGLRLRRGGWALLPCVALLAAAAVLGTDTAPLPAARAVVFTLAAALWMGWHRSYRLALAGSPAATRQPAAAAALLLVAALAGGGAALALPDPGYRTIARDRVEPPLDLREVPSPLAGYRQYLRETRDVELLRVEGLPAGARLRLATLDTFDGLVYNVSAGAGRDTDSGVFARVTDRLPAPRRPADLAGAQSTTATVQVTVGQYSNVWVPLAGQAREVVFTGGRAGAVRRNLYFNAATGTMLTTEKLRPGDTYTAVVDLPATATDEEVGRAPYAALNVPAPANVPESVSATATDLVGGATGPLERARALEESLRREGFFSHGLAGEARSKPGHGAARIDALLAGAQMVGDDEQYAVAMALMARQLGMPARVVMGFAQPAGAGGGGDGAVVFTGDDVRAWVEIPFQGVGWVAFDPTPPQEQRPLEEAPEPKTNPQPQVLQPPLPPQEPAELPPASSPDDREDDPAGTPGWLTTLVAVLLFLLRVAGYLLLLLLPFLLVVGVKWWRRRQRRTAGTASDKVGGAWREFLDTARDLGARPAPGATRREAGAAVQAVLPHAPALALAYHADAGVFAPGTLTEEKAAAFWGEVDTAVAGLRAGTSRWRWLRARVDPRSLVPASEGYVRLRSRGPRAFFGRKK